MKTLALPKSKMQPPPKKSEIIDAMTRLRVEKNIAERKKQVAERMALWDEIERELKALAITSSGHLAMSVHEGNFRYKEKHVEGVYVSVLMPHTVLGKELHDKLKKFHNLPEREFSNDQYYYKMIRKEVAELVNGLIPHAERVNALLADETAKAAMEKMLETLEK